MTIPEPPSTPAKLPKVLRVASTRSTGPSPAGSPPSELKLEGSPGSMSPGSSVSKSLAKALAKAEQASQQKSQKREELRVAEEWNEIFKSVPNRRDPQKVQRFWTEVKTRLIRRFGTIHAAFRTFDVSGDNGLSFLKFGDMLRLTHFPLDQRISRELFEKASGGDHKLSLSELKVVLMERTIEKLQFVMVGYNEKQDRIQGHIQSFLGRLASSDEFQRARGVDRFQQKLTVDFCRQLYQTLMKRLAPKGSAVQDVAVDRSTYAKFINESVLIRFQAYEVPYLMQIFDRIDCNGRGSIGIVALVTMMLLISPESDRCRKVGLLFEVHDADCDGCLLYDQILAMFQCICAQRPFADESTRTSDDMTFQEELSLQEGLRAYESTCWFLKRGGKVDGDVVAQRELWEALSRQPQLLGELLPGTIRMRWAQPVMPDEDRRLSSEHRPSFSEELEKPKVMMGKSRTDTPNAKLLGWHNESSRKQRLQPEDFGDGARMQGCDEETPKMQRRDSKGSASVGARLRAATAPAWDVMERMGEASTPNAATASTSDPVGICDLEAPLFRQRTTRNFQQSLRSLGEQRLTELTAGFDPPLDVCSDADQTKMVSRSMHANGMRAQTPPLAGRGGAPGLASLGLTAARPASEQRERDGSRNTMARVNSAPAGALGQSPSAARNGAAPRSSVRPRRVGAWGPRGAQGSRGSSQQHRDVVSTNHKAKVPSPPAGPAVDAETKKGLDVLRPESEKWGPEAAERFRLFCAVKSSFGRHVPNARQPADLELGTKFKCHVCQREHNMNEGCAF